MIAKQECRCCQKARQTGDMHHCRECWDEHHKDGRIDGKSDWLNQEEFDKERKRKC